MTSTAGWDVASQRQTKVMWPTLRLSALEGRTRTADADRQDALIRHKSHRKSKKRVPGITWCFRVTPDSL